MKILAKKKLYLLPFLCFLSTVNFAQTNNEFQGIGSGASVTSGDRNTGYGDSSLTNLSTSLHNVGIGFRAGFLINRFSTTQANYNVLVGFDAGYSLSSGDDNVFMGYQAGFSNTTGTDNVMIGFRAGFFNNATDGTFIGNGAGFNNTTGSDNTFLGQLAGASVTTGRDNTFIGDLAGANIFTVSVNTTATTTPTTGNDNTGVGSQALYNIESGYQNTAIGNDAGYDIISGYKNTALGDLAGFDIGAGYLNTMIGQESGTHTEHGDYNTFVGAQAGWDNNRTNNTNDANYNTALGFAAGYTNREGQRNIAIGALADFSSVGSIENNDNIIVGYDATLFGSGTTGRSRSIIMGSNAKARNNDNIGIGYNTDILGNRAIAIGNYSDVNNQGAIALGYQTYVNGDYSIALGESDSVNGAYSVALGYAAAAKSNYAVAIGAGASADSANTMVLGGATTTDRVSVGIGTNYPSPFASLDMADTDKGLLLNRLSAAQITTYQSGIGTGEEGMALFDTDNDQLKLWDGAAWINISANTDQQDLSLVSNTLSLTNDSSTVDLSGYLDNTDAQTLTLTGTSLAISGGNAADLSSLQDGTGTDDQNISGSNLTGTNLTIAIENGSSEVVNLSSLQDGVNDADADPTNEHNTTVILNGTDLETTDGGGTIITDLSSLVGSGGSDDQNLTGSSLTGTMLQIDIENGTSTSVDLGPLLVNLQNTINALTIRVDSLELAVNTCCGTSLKVEGIDGDNGPILGQNYPNPFNESTTIEYYLPNTVQTSYMDILAVNGALVKTIQINSRGDGHIILETGDMAPGNYFYSMYADSQLIGTKQMIIAN